MFAFLYVENHKHCQ